jgi:hypothetical protein
MLNIDTEFSKLIPPLSEEEFRQLEQNIISEGCRDPLFTWKGFIVDGHNRFTICSQHGIHFKTKRLSFESKNDAILWILENQLGRRNLSDAMRIELAMQKAKLTPHNPENGTLNTRKVIAQNANVSEQTVQRYMKIRQIADPKTLSQLQNGEKKIGTIHREFEVKTKTVIKLNTPQNHHKNVLNRINVIKHFYRLARENSENNSDNSGVFQKRFYSHSVALGKILSDLQSFVRTGG